MAHGLRHFLALSVCAVVSLGTTAALANSKVNVQVFRPSPHQGALVNVDGSNLPDDNVWTMSTMMNYGKNPLVFVWTKEGREDKRDEVIQDQLTLDVMASYSVLKWVDVGIAFPIHLLNEGDAPRLGYSEDDVTIDDYNPDFGSMVMGDLRLSTKVRLLHRDTGDQGFGLALNNTFSLPTGDPKAFVTDGFAWQPTVIADFKAGALHLSTNVGASVRESQALPAQSRPLAEIGTGMTYGAGALYRIVGETNAAVTVRGVDFDMMVEVHGGTSDFTPNTSNLEGLLAGRVSLPDIGLAATLGGGSGWLAGYGNVKSRVFVGLNYAMPHERDYDEDGILDEDDACQEQAEDFDDYEDSDGCPDPDNDGDKVTDAADRCPNDAEDFDKFQDEDGCPDLDNDGDTIPDDRDKCPLEPEDRDGFQDADGCQDSDNDGDGMADIADRCPDEKETVNGYQDDDGCPDESLAKVESGRIAVLDKVYFEKKEADLMPQSFPVLQAVAGILRVTSSIKKLRIEAHTDDRGTDRSNQKLSQAQAEAVMAFLVQEGVDAGRLEAVGMGEEKPAVEGRSAEARVANRRVEFIIAE